MAGVLVTGVLSARPAWQVAGVVAIVVFAVFAEVPTECGAKRTARHAGHRANLTGKAAGRVIGLWLDERVREIRALQSSLGAVLLAGPVQMSSRLKASRTDRM